VSTYAIIFIPTAFMFPYLTERWTLWIYNLELSCI